MSTRGKNTKARELADRCGVRYEDVVDWLNDNFTPAEIERACRIAQDKAARTDDVLAMLDAGLDWRAIEKALRTVPDIDDLDDEEAY